MPDSCKVAVINDPAPSKPWWKSKTLQFMKLVGLSQVLLLASVSILPAFFPLQAAKKGASPLEYGLIMGICYLALGLSSIPWGHVTTKFSTKNQLVLSIMATGIFTILFGYVDRLPNGAYFLCTAFALRILIGMACSVFQVAAYAMVPAILVGRESTGFAVLELAVGVGYMIGPALGGTLFDIGGFSFPLLASGILLLVIAFLCILFIKNPVIVLAEEEVSMAKLVFCPSVILYSLVIFSTEVDFGYLAVTLEPLLEEFNLSHSAIGGIVLCSGAAYAITTPMWGHVLDKGESAEFGSLMGTITAVQVFLFLGPVPWIPLDNQCLGRIIFCVIICGLAVAAKMICGFNMLMYSALVVCGFPDNVVTYAIVSAVYTLVVSVGGFAGPFVGGLLQETMGLREGTSVMFFWELFLVVCQLLYISSQKCRMFRKPNVRTTQLQTEDTQEKCNSKTLTNTSL